ncbi:hypothetical protein SH1V18_36450 [Vallitalea longa]|uniref:RNA polymerase sigma-70 domain-containing protein n=1 Tax=Vallitalea longa TaxID=2936439 RepID=A0A9W5YBW7_9FIRM|nr:hypothetical protein SH1V18_36450 [Vallitalea longa]
MLFNFLTFILPGFYFTTSQSFPKPLSSDEERKYLIKCKEGDMQARNILIERNLRLVAHIVKKYNTTDRDMDDLISIGTIGLIKAITTFDIDKGTRLATYAARCIENAIHTKRRTHVTIWIPLIIQFFFTKEVDFYLISIPIYT